MKYYEEGHRERNDRRKRQGRTKATRRHTANESRNDSHTIAVQRRDVCMPVDITSKPSRNRRATPWRKVPFSFPSRGREKTQSRREGSPPVGGTTQCQEKKSTKLAQELAAKSRALAVDTCQACSATRKNVGACDGDDDNTRSRDTGYVKSSLTAVPGVARRLAHCSHADGDGRHGTKQSMIAAGLREKPDA